MYRKFEEKMVKMENKKPPLPIRQCLCAGLARICVEEEEEKMLVRRKRTSFWSERFLNELPGKIAKRGDAISAC